MASEQSVIDEMLAEAASVMNLTPAAAPAAPVVVADVRAAAEEAPVLGAKEVKIQTPLGGEIVVPLDEVRRAYGDIWMPAEGQRTRSGRQVKPVKRFVQEVYEDDDTDEDDVEMSTDDEARNEEPDSEDEAFIADDDEEDEAVDEEEEEEESSADSVETEEEEEEAYSGESDEEEESDDDFFSSSENDE